MHDDGNRSNQSRRTLLKLGAAGLAGLALNRGLASLAIAAEGTDDYGGLPLGLQSYTLRDRPFKNALEAMNKDLGLRYVEVYSQHLGWTSSPDMVKINAVNAKPEEALELLKSYNVTV